MFSKKAVQFMEMGSTCVHGFDLEGSLKKRREGGSVSRREFFLIQRTSFVVRARLDWAHAFNLLSRTAAPSILLEVSMRTWIWAIGGFR